MKRRKFIQNSSLVTVPGLLGGIPVSAISSSSLTNFINGDSDRVLVLIQLNGGNDGLATIIPKDQQDNLAAVRPNIYIPESSFLDVSDTVALHPSMEGFKSLYDDAKVNIVQDVGYPDQNRSHFRSSDIWHTGSNSNEFLGTGWIGRYLDSKFPGFPSAYPTEDCPHPFALTIGSTVSETCQGEAGNFSMAIVDPTNLSQLASPTNNEILDGCAGGRMDFLVTSIEQTNVYSEIISDVYDQGNNLSDKYSDDNDLSQKLATVARLIAGGMQSKIYVVSLGGFDTHADQTVDGEPTTGIHSNLLQTLSDAVCAFQDDLKLLGLEERVIGMTYSEFGRRIRSNFSFGTDHGTAAPLIVFGSCVNAGIIGDTPTISTDVSQNEGVPMQYDFRSVYGSLLIDWFGISEDEVMSIFDFDFQYLAIANTCAGTVNTNDTVEDQFNLKVLPNPFSSNVQLEFNTENDWIKISVFNAIGSEVKVLTNKQLAAGLHRLNFDLNGLAAGAYFVRIQNKVEQKTVRLIKQL